jgi:hypothetical protein
MLCPNCSRPGKPVPMHKVTRKIHLYDATFSYKTVWVCFECGLEVDDTIENVVENIMRSYVKLP